ncbi:MAG TPA: BON domain-containing protein [Acidimicrobiia bacterium]|nr:BON domain-containing protein [Acidimicrobiia bacterium]
MKSLRRLFGSSGPAVAWWAWEHRDEVLDWAGFGVRSTRKLLSGEGGDAATEARIRAALTTDSRTRRAPGLHVEVHDGVARLDGAVAEDVRDVACNIAARTAGVRRVEDRLEVLGRRRRLAF